MKHPHAEILKAFIEDMSVDIEYENAAGWEIAYPAQLINDIHGVVGFRIKSKMRSINGIEFPEPMRVAPAVDSIYWVFDIYGGAYSIRWDGDCKDIKVFESGFCHLTEEAAQQHRKAIVLANGGEL